MGHNRLIDTWNWNYIMYLKTCINAITFKFHNSVPVQRYQYSDMKSNLSLFTDLHTDRSTLWCQACICKLCSGLCRDRSNDLCRVRLTEGTDLLLTCTQKSAVCCQVWLCTLLLLNLLFGVTVWICKLFIDLCTEVLFDVKSEFVYSLLTPTQIVVLFDVKSEFADSLPTCT